MFSFGGCWTVVSAAAVTAVVNWRRWRKLDDANTDANEFIPKHFLSSSRFRSRFRTFRDFKDKRLEISSVETKNRRSAVFKMAPKLRNTETSGNKDFEKFLPTFETVTFRSHWFYSVPSETILKLFLGLALAWWSSHRLDWTSCFQWIEAFLFTFLFFVI